MVSYEFALIADRYSSAIAVILLFWDHLSTLDREVSCIWTNPEEGYIGKIVFSLNRYLTEALLVYSAYVMSGVDKSLNNHECRRFVWIFCMIIALFFLIAKVVIVLRIYGMWEKKRFVGGILSLSFFVAASCTIGVTAYATNRSMVHVVLYISSNGGYRTCIFTDRPRLYPLVLGSLAGFDLFAILMIVLNAAEKPYQRNRELVRSIRRDGVVFFISLFAFRVVALLTYLLTNPSVCFMLLPLLWASSSIVHSHLHLRGTAMTLAKEGAISTLDEESESDSEATDSDMPSATSSYVA